MIKSVLFVVQDDPVPENTISEVKANSRAPDTQPSKGGATYMDVEENGPEEGEVRNNM